MSGGQQITSGQGTLTAAKSDVATGSEATTAAGDTGNTHFLPLRSKKIGGGSASAVLGGQAITGATGSLTSASRLTPSGIQISAAQGTLSYRGQATISWTAVTTNSDGTPLTDLAGYRILHGTAPTVYFESVTLGIVTSYAWGGLSPGTTHYFVVEAFDTSNNFSPKSAEVTKTY